MPKNKTIIVHTNEKEKFEEAILTEMRGSYGTHHIGRLWGINGPEFLRKGILGYRIYPKGSKPVVMETKVINKFISGKGNVSLPEKGEIMYPVILFSQDSIRFEGMWLHKERTNANLVGLLLAEFSLEGIGFK